MYVLHSSVSESRLGMSGPASYEDEKGEERGQRGRPAKRQKADFDTGYIASLVAQRTASFPQDWLRSAEISFERGKEQLREVKEDRKIAHAVEMLTWVLGYLSMGRPSEYPKPHENKDHFVFKARRSDVNGHSFSGLKVSKKTGAILEMNGTKPSRKMTVFDMTFDDVKKIL